jgi:hypothetical protein
MKPLRPWHLSALKVISDRCQRSLEPLREIVGLGQRTRTAPRTSLGLELNMGMTATGTFGC